MNEPLNLKNEPLNLNYIPAQRMKDILHSATAVAADSDLQRYRQSGLRLAETFQKRLDDAQQAYTIGRAKLVAETERKMAELQRAYHDELRAFDEQHERIRDELHEQITALGYIRDVTEL